MNGAVLLLIALADERHVRPVAYGGMLLEGVLAIVAIVAVAGAYTTPSDYLAAAAAKAPAQLFASSIAALTLLTATMWFVKNRKPCWLTAVPMVFMTVVSAWSLALIFSQSVAAGDFIRITATGFLLILAIVLAALGINRFRST